MGLFNVAFLKKYLLYDDSLYNLSILNYILHLNII